MTQIQIINRIDRHCGLVPAALWQIPNLPSHAKLCAAYLFALGDGPTPYVSQIERDTGLSRDARRKAFRQLQHFGIVQWDEVRNEAQQIVSKTLTVNYLRVMTATAQEVE